MSYSREELKTRYKCLILKTGTEKELFRTNCSNFLSENKLSDCFKLLPIRNVRKDFLEKATARKDVEFRHLANVFELFEKYAVNILDKPWYKDLKTIKVCFELDTLNRLFVQNCVIPSTMAAMVLQPLFSLRFV